LAWFQNQWLYRWHFIGGASVVEFDDFRGGSIRYAGLAFSGTTRDVFWNAIARGVRKEIADQFAWVDEHVRRYNRPTALSAIDECAGMIVSFAVQVRRAAVEKDRILRGNGVDFPERNDAGWWEGATPADIGKFADSLKAGLPEAAQHMPSPVLPSRPPSWRATAAVKWNENQWWLGPIGFVVGAAGLVLPFL
jgi:hypothetical protein